MTDGKVDIHATRKLMLKDSQDWSELDRQICNQMDDEDAKVAIAAWQLAESRTAGSGNRLLIFDAYRRYREGGLEVPDWLMSLVDMIVSDVLNAQTPAQLVTAVTKRPRQRENRLGPDRIDGPKKMIWSLSHYQGLVGRKRNPVPPKRARELAVAGTTKRITTPGNFKNWLAQARRAGLIARHRQPR